MAEGEPKGEISIPRQQGKGPSCLDLRVILCGPASLLDDKGDQSWVFIGRTDAEAESPILWPPHVKS